MYPFIPSFLPLFLSLSLSPYQLSGWACRVWACVCLCMCVPVDICKGLVHTQFLRWNCKEGKLWAWHHMSFWSTYFSLWPEMPWLWYDSLVGLASTLRKLCSTDNLLLKSHFVLNWSSLETFYASCSWFFRCIPLNIHPKKMVFEGRETWAIKWVWNQLNPVWSLVPKKANILKWLSESSSHSRGSWVRWKSECVRGTFMLFSGDHGNTSV